MVLLAFLYLYNYLVVPGKRTVEFTTPTFLLNTTTGGRRTVVRLGCGPGQPNFRFGW